MAINNNGILVERQYIGARYVTKIYENSQDAGSAEWEANTIYEPLILVTYQYGSYLSKKVVPATIGNPPSNPEYWVQTGYYNGQISNLQSQIDEINNVTIPNAIDEAKSAYDTMLVIGEATTLDSVNASITALGKKCILIVGADINCEGGGTINSNVVKVIGAGGKFTYTTETDTNVIFPDNCIVESNNQLFDSYIIAKGNNLQGEVLPIWWGIAGTKNVDVQIPMNRLMGSDFTQIHFVDGVYMANINNTKSNRTMYFDDKAIVDGVIHAAVGTSALNRVENVKLKGKINTTLRVGTYNCRHVEIDDIYLMDKDTSYDGQQAQNGQPVGVHLYYNSSYVDIKNIIAGTVEPRPDTVRNGVLIIDNDGTNPSPDHVTIGNVIVGNNSMAGTYNAAVYVLSSPYLTIRTISINSNTGLRAVQIDRCPYAHIGNLSITDASTGGVSFDFDGSGAMGKVDNAIIYSSGSITAAVSCTGGSNGLDLTIDNLKASGTITHGINAAEYSRVTVVRGTIVATNPTTQDATSTITKLS